MKFLLFLLSSLTILTGCSQGEFDNTYDRHLNTFGLHYAPPTASFGGFIGRALISQDTPATWSQIYLTSSSKEVQDKFQTANTKGGFYFPNLEPGMYQAYIVSPAGQGKTLELTIVADEVLELPEIYLESLAKITGNVTLAEEPVHSGTQIYVPGTPFSAHTDQDGAFFMEVPRGSYVFRAERDNYIAQETELLSIDDSYNLDLTLQPNPWPSGTAIVESEDGYVVRGLTTKIHLQTVPGVKYMRIVSSNAESRWIPVKPELELTHKSDGARSLSILFMDAYGKFSEPIDVRYYNTSLDETWTVFHGKFLKPITIAPHSKVAFLNTYDVNDSSAVEDSDGSVSGPPVTVDEPDSDSGSAPDSDVFVLRSVNNLISRDLYPSETVVFGGMVVIGEGTQIQGSAQFASGLAVNGTKSNPVEWNTEERVHVSIQKATNLNYLNAQNLSLSVIATKGSINKIFNSSFVDSKISHDSFSLPWSGGISELQIKHTSLQGTIVSQECDTAIIGDADSTTDDDGDAPDEPERSGVAGRASISLKQNKLNESSIGLECESHEDFEAYYVVQGNNFLKPYSGEFVFHSWHYRHDGTLPSDEEAEFLIDNNYYQQPDKQYGGLHAHGWRFGENVSQAHQDVGPL